MAKQTISITRALTERKRLTDRINNALSQPFVGIQKGIDGQAEVIGLTGKTVTDAEKAYKANFDTVQGLIKYRNAITAAIVQSNAVTKVNIAGEEMTVAVAIERKTSIAIEDQFVRNLVNQISIAGHSIARANAEIENRIEQMVIQLVGGKDKSKLPTADQRAEIANPIEKSGKQQLIDPNKLHDVATQMLTGIGDFKSQVDYILSESNAKTEIEIEDFQPEVKTEVKKEAEVTA